MSGTIYVPNDQLQESIAVSRALLFYGWKCWSELQSHGDKSWLVYFAEKPGYPQQRAVAPDELKSRCRWQMENRTSTISMGAL